MDGIYELTLGGVNAAGNYAENVSHWVVHGTSGSDAAWSTAAELCAAFNVNMMPSLANCLSQDCKYNVLSAKRVDGPGGPSYQAGIEQQGLRTDDAFSNVVAIDIAMYPGGAKNRVGHWYFWGVSVIDIVADVVTSAMLALLNTFMGVLLSVMTVGSGTAVLATYSKATNTATVVTDLVTRQKISGFSKRTSPIV